MVKHAHSQWFNVLSELGVVGLALFVASIVLFVAAMVGNPFSQRRDPLHPLLVALQAGVIAFVVHLTADWDWDMAAIGTARLRVHRRLRLLPGDPGGRRAARGAQRRGTRAADAGDGGSRASRRGGAADGGRSRRGGRRARRGA